MANLRFCRLARSALRSRGALPNQRSYPSTPAGNPGDAMPVGTSASELQSEYRSDYRVYFIMRADTMVVLLCSGNKRHQDREIARALQSGAIIGEERCRSQSDSTGCSRFVGHHRGPRTFLDVVLEDREHDLIKVALGDIGRA